MNAKLIATLTLLTVFGLIIIGTRVGADDVERPASTPLLTTNQKGNTHKIKLYPNQPIFFSFTHFTGHSFYQSSTLATPTPTPLYLYLYLYLHKTRTHAE
jgi:hypothetical protein